MPFGCGHARLKCRDVCAHPKLKPVSKSGASGNGPRRGIKKRKQSKQTFVALAEKQRKRRRRQEKTKARLALCKRHPRLCVRPGAAFEPLCAAGQLSYTRDACCAATCSQCSDCKGCYGGATPMIGVLDSSVAVANATVVLQNGSRWQRLMLAVRRCRATAARMRFGQAA